MNEVNVPNDSTPAPEELEIITEAEGLNPEDDDKKGKEEEERFKEGQLLRMVRVRFPGNARSFPFLIGRRKINYGQKVVAMSDRGVAVGYINSFPYEVYYHKEMGLLRSINKIATDEDIQKEKDTYKREKEVETLCQNLIEKHQLDMYLTHVEFTQFGKKAVFYFIAPARVDFRDLVKDLVGELKMRIELRQISVRDRSASVGGIGPCGRELCCSSFLSKYGNVGIKMAKTQDLTLNYSKLNGVCGQLKCCLQYEDEVYLEKRRRLPEIGSIIKTKNGDIGRVDKLHLLSEMFDIFTVNGVRKRMTQEMFENTIDDPNIQFDQENFSDETHKIVGLEETKNLKKSIFDDEMKDLNKRSSSFTKETFTTLMGAESLFYSLPDIQEGASSINIIQPNDLPEVDTSANTFEPDENLNIESSNAESTTSGSTLKTNEPRNKKKYYNNRSRRR